MLTIVRFCHCQSTKPHVESHRSRISENSTNFLSLFFGNAQLRSKAPNVLRIWIYILRVYTGWKEQRIGRFKDPLGKHKTQRQRLESWMELPTTPYLTTILRWLTGLLLLRESPSARKRTIALWSNRKSPVSKLPCTAQESNPCFLADGK